MKLWTLVLLAAFAICGGGCKTRSSHSRSDVQYSGDTQAQKMEIAGERIVIACFSGPNDDENSVKKKCAMILAECKKYYEVKRENKDKLCIDLTNPTLKRIRGMRSLRLLVVIAHSTAPGASPDTSENLSTTEFDIWDSPISPDEIAAAHKNVPIIWYGCFGAGIARTCANVIPLQSEEALLSTDDPIVDCRFGSTIRCLELAPGPFNQAEMAACVEQMMASQGCKQAASLQQ